MSASVGMKAAADITRVRSGPTACGSAGGAATSWKVTIPAGVGPPVVQRHERRAVVALRRRHGLDADDHAVERALERRGAQRDRHGLGRRLAADRVEARGVALAAEEVRHLHGAAGQQDETRQQRQALAHGSAAVHAPSDSRSRAGWEGQNAGRGGTGPGPRRGLNRGKPRTRPMATARFDEIADDFAFLDDWEDRYRYVIELGRAMPPPRRRAEEPGDEGRGLRQPGVDRAAARPGTARGPLRLRRRVGRPDRPRPDRRPPRALRRPRPRGGARGRRAGGARPARARAAPVLAAVERPPRRWSAASARIAQTALAQA